MNYQTRFMVKAQNEKEAIIKASIKTEGIGNLKITKILKKIHKNGKKHFIVEWYF